MSKAITITITATVGHVDGPRVRDLDSIREALDSELDGYQFEAQDPERDDVSVLRIDTITVT